MYCIRVSTDQIEDPKHQKGAEHGAEAHAQQECRREHKHYDVPHDAIDCRHQQGAKQIPDTHEKRRFQDAEGGVFKPCQQRKGIQQNDAVQNCRTDTRNITPQNGSFTSGFARGRCVVTAKAANPALVCAWLDQMYAPLQSPQNNWGTYGDAEGFNIFELSTNDKGEPMLKHAPLGDASPVEVREAQCVSGPLAVLDDYYGVYVTCPDDAQYRLDWIKEIYTPDMNNDYVYPNVFMSNEDTEQVSNLQADLQTYMNTQKANWIMNGTTDAEWNEYLSKLEAYGLSDYLGIMQKYLDAYYA